MPLDLCTLTRTEVKEISALRAECVYLVMWTLTETSVLKKVGSERIRRQHHKYHSTVFAVTLVDGVGRFALLMSQLRFSQETSKLVSYTVDLPLVVYQEYILTHC